MHLKLIIQVVILMLPVLHCGAQKNIVNQAKVDNRAYVLKTESALGVYSSKMFNEFAYIYGKEYKVEYLFGHNTPYLNNKVGAGAIFSKRDVYDNVMLLYDLKTECIVALTQKFGMSAQYVQLNDAAVDSVAIDYDGLNYVFRFLSFKDGEDNVMENGYYEVPYKGKMRLFVKHVVKSYTKDGIETFVFDKRYFLNKDDQYYPVNRQKQLFRLFAEHKKELRKRIRTYRTYYNQLSTFYMVDLMGYIDALNCR